MLVFRGGPILAYSTRESRSHCCLTPRLNRKNAFVGKTAAIFFQDSKIIGVTFDGKAFALLETVSYTKW